MPRLTPLPSALLTAVLALAAVALPATANALTCSVADYGAIPDDAVDDTTEIQAALDSACGVVSLPAGAYLVSDTLLVPSDSGLDGAGVLHQTADVTTIENADIVSGNDSIALRGFGIAKDFVDNSLADGIRLVRTEGIEISDVEITGISARSGIELLLCDDFLVADNHLHDYSATATGVLADGDPVSIDSIYIRTSSNGTVSGNRVEDMDAGPSLQTDGIFVSAAANVDVLDNEIRNVGEGIDLGAVDDVLVEGNVVEDAQAFGIKVGNGSTTSTVTGNTILRAQMSAVYIFAGASTVAGNGPTEDITVTDNTITNVGSDGTANHPFPGSARVGVYVDGDRSDWPPIARTVIDGNVITDDQTTHTMEYGILVLVYTSDTTYTGNTISGWTIQAIRDDS